MAIKKNKDVVNTVAKTVVKEVKKPTPTVSLTRFNKVSKELTSVKNVILNQKDEIASLSVESKQAKVLNDELIDLINMILGVIPQSKKPWYFWLTNAWPILKSILTLIKDFKSFKEEEGVSEVQGFVGKIDV